MGKSQAELFITIMPPDDGKLHLGRVSCKKDINLPKICGMAGSAVSFTEEASLDA
jgi:hypothetical protein